jgi:hypothetical protein
MRLRRAGQRDRWRVAVFAAVVGLHFLAGLLLFATGSIRIARLSAADKPLSLLWLSQENPAKPPVSSPASIPERSLKRSAASPDIEPPSNTPAPQPQPSNAITLPLDLSAYADEAARRQSEKEGNERRRRNLAGPQDSQLEWSRNNVPLVRDYHQLNDTEHAEGGEVITWMNDKCFYTNHGITTFGLPQTSMVCKDPPKPETELFKDMRKKLDEGAKGSAP